MLHHILAVLTSTKSEDMMAAHIQKLAAVCSGRVTLLRLFNPLSDKSRSTRVVDPLDYHLRKLEGETLLKQMAENLRATGLDVTTVVLESADVEQLAQYAESNGVDIMLLVKQNAMDDLLHNVMKRTTIPTVIIPADDTLSSASSGSYRRIMLPLDGSKRAEISLPVASALAREHNAQFVVAHVVRKPELPRHAPPNPEELELSERIVELNRAEAARYLESFASRLPGEVETRLLVSENIAATLHQLAEQERIDLVVLSAHGYSGEPRWPYGSITGNLLAYSTRPMLVVQDLPAMEASAGAAPGARLFRRAR